jgi:hypothetical protein
MIALKKTITMKNLFILLALFISLNVFSQDTWDFDDTIVLVERGDSYTYETIKENRKRKEIENSKINYSQSYSYRNPYSTLWVPYQVTNARRNYIVKSHLNSVRYSYRYR